MAQTLTPKQKELFEKLLAQRRAGDLAPRPSGTTPLSFAQERIYFLEQLAPANTAYTVAWAFDVYGDFDSDIFRDAFEDLRNRHESLRLQCRVREGQPEIVFAEKGSCQLTSLELGGMSPESITAEMTKQARKPFDLENDHLSRLIIARVSTEHRIVMIQSHHLVVDSWSAKIILGEVSAIYNAKVKGEILELSDLPLSYSDFAYWQREQSQKDQWIQQLEFWERTLEDLPAHIGMPTVYPRPEMRSYRGKKSHFRFHGELLSKLDRLTVEQGVTNFTILLSLFKAFLSRLSGQNDIIVGTALADRFPKETEAMIGSFATILPLRSQLDSDSSLNSLMPRVRSVVASALANKNVPFERIVESVAPSRDLSIEPIFQVMFILHEDPLEEELVIDGCRVKRHVVEKGGARFELMLEMVKSPNELFGWLEYSEDIYDAETVAQWVQDFLSFVETALHSPDIPLAQIDYLRPSQKQSLMELGQGPEVLLPSSSRLEALIEAQSAKSPNSVAVQFLQQSISYSELTSKAEAVEQRLREQGLKAGELALICGTKALDLISEMLAIWRIRASFLPLSAQWPQSRLDHIQRQSGAHWKYVDGRLEALSPQSPAPLDPNRAYCMSTSGSLGSPKVVAVGHESTVNLLQSMASLLEIKAQDKLLSATNTTFDIALLELFLPLTVGASVVLLSDDQKGGCGIKDALDRCNPTFMQATPTMWRMILDTDWKQAESLTILCGGEALSSELAQRLLALSPKAIWNLYGPTETTIWSTAQRVTRDTTNRIPLGSAIDNTQITVTDSWGNLVPPLVVGEIRISGKGLAQGYLNESKDFLDQGSYRTGDLGSWSQDGQLYFHGRRDAQVKVRGVRIELPEIEAALLTHPNVSEAAAVVNDDRIETYIVGEQTTSTELRHHAQKELPDTHLPSVFTFVESLPQNTSGKIDRPNLHKLTGTQAAASLEYQAPETDAQIKIAEFYSQLLDQRHVGLQDDFFALGGHSLIAMSLIFSIESHFQIRFPLRRIFEYPSVNALAEQVEMALLEEIESLGEQEAETLLQQAVHG